MVICSRLHAYLILAQIAFAGFEIVSRIALTGGTHPVPFTFYRNLIAAILIGIAAFMKERNHKRPDWRTLIYLFGLGFLGVTVNQVCYLAGLKYTSAIFASAMRNSTPVFTFVIAALSRIEKVDTKRRDGQLKVLGSVLGLVGSLILSIYRGPIVINSNISISHSQGTTTQVDADAKKTLNLLGIAHITLASWQIGAMFLAISCIAFGAFLILQAPVLERYPAPISFAAFSCLSSVVQIPILGVIYDRKWSGWKLSSTSEALTILYAGVVGSALVSTIQSWGVLTRGPVIVAAYQPLETIFTALFSMIFLKEDLHLGSVVGGAIVIAGLYLLVWGQHKERIIMKENQELPITVATLTAECHPNEPPKSQVRRYSCDLETRRKGTRNGLDAARRHSVTGPVYEENLRKQVVLSDAAVGKQRETSFEKQGPLRRMSSTFRTLLREFEIIGSAVGPDGEQLLPEKRRSHNEEPV